MGVCLSLTSMPRPSRSCHSIITLPPQCASSHTPSCIRKPVEKKEKKKKEKSQVEPPSFKVFHKVWYPLPRPPVLGAWFDRVTVGVGPTASQVCINRFSSRQVHKQLGAQNPYSLELLIFSFVLPVSVLVTTCLDRPPFGSANDVHA